MPIPPFTYIPPNPRATYRELLDKMLEYDLEAMATLPEDQEVSLGILTAEHLGLLGECALRWRLSQMFRSWTFLSCMQEKFEGGQVPVDCVFEALGMVRKVLAEVALDHWPLPDVSFTFPCTTSFSLFFPPLPFYLEHQLTSDHTHSRIQRTGLESTCLKIYIHFYSTIESSLASSSSISGYNSPDVQEAIQSFQTVTIDSPIPISDLIENRQHPNPSIARIENGIIERIRAQAFKSYINESGERIEHEGGKNRGFAMGMAGWIESGAKKLNKKFGDAVTE